MALKAKLGEVRSDQWQKAQCIFDEICALCEVKGPSNGMMVPRACRVCHYYGHTKQFCPVWKARVERMTDRELELCGPRYIPPQCVEECRGGPEQWAWIQHLREVDARVKEGMEKKIGKPRPGCKRYKRTITCASDRVAPAECGCAACVEWEDWVAPVRWWPKTSVAMAHGETSSTLTCERSADNSSCSGAAAS